MKHYNIPPSLQDEAFAYYNHLYSKRLSDNDQQIINDLPVALQKELKLYMNIKLISTVPIFKSCGGKCLRDVAMVLEQNFYSPGQDIVQVGEIGEEMFIIGHGSVEVLVDEKSVANLHEGQFFGESALLQRTTRNANVKGKSYCDLYKLKKEDFLKIIQKHPKLLQNIEDVVRNRV
jgi:voltage-gated potassium channel